MTREGWSRRRQAIRRNNCGNRRRASRLQHLPAATATPGGRAGSVPMTHAVGEANATYTATTPQAMTLETAASAVAADGKRRASRMADAWSRPSAPTEPR